MNLASYFDFNGVILEHLQEADIDEAVALINPAYSYQEKVKGEPRTNPIHLSRRVEETDFYVAKMANKIIGCVYIEPKGSSLHFGLLTVADSHRKTGLAPAMIKAIKRFATENHYKSLDLDYMSLAPWLRKYYEGYGFRETGESIKWGKIDLIHMSMDLGSSNVATEGPS